MMSLPEIDSSEIFGRGIFDGSRAKEAAKGKKIHPKVFREKDGREISVDRLSFGAWNEIALSHRDERQGQQFHGWAVVNHSDICAMGRTVASKPIVPKNIWHAEIILPLAESSDEKDEMKAHSLNLANNARWEPAPTRD